jgi:hypothetical protein
MNIFLSRSQVRLSANLDGGAWERFPEALLPFLLSFTRTCEIDCSMPF